MEIEVARQLFKQLDSQNRLSKIIKDYKTAMRYYRNYNDIAYRKDKDKDKREHPLRVANNAISSNFYQVLVDQKAAYVAGEPPLIDTGNGELNERVADVLGDKYEKIVQRLVIDASHAGLSWLHVWRDEDNGEFRYAIVPPDQITPIYNNDMERRLYAVRRTYTGLDVDGKQYVYDEYWTDKEVSYFKRELDETRLYDTLQADYRIQVIKDSLLNDQVAVNTIEHQFSSVPFIQFDNNAFQLSDLTKNKGHIDAYDKVYNGFLNDLEDVQQVILILKGYEGETLDEFRKLLQAKKSIKVDPEHGGLETLTIDIPVEARNAFLETTEKLIYRMGQGVNPSDLMMNTSLSGIAIKMLYSLLELKASALEAEFRPSIARLIRFVLEYLEVDAKSVKITQKWTRSLMTNDGEVAEMVARLADVTSAEAIAKSNPLVEDWQRELELKATLADPYALDEADE